MHKHYLLTFILTIVLAFDASAQHTWTPKADLPNANRGRHHPVSWGIGDYGYVVTGTTSQQGTTNDFFRYDPATDTWTVMDDFPGLRRSFSIGDVYNGEGYIGFGFSQTTNSVLNDLWKYNPSTDDWTQLASCPCQGRRHPVFSINQNEGKLYVGLGDNLQANLKDWWVYDIANNSWKALEDFPGSRRHHPFHFAIDDYVFAGLGHGSAIYDDFYRYNPVDSSWNTAALSPDVRAAGTEFSYNGYGFVLSGDAQNHLPTNPSIFWRYNPENDTWSSMPPHPGFSRWAPGSFIVNGTLYFFAGQDGASQNLVGTMFSFELESYLNTEELAADMPFRIYPNPSEGSVTIDTDVTFVRAKLVDKAGKIISDTPFAKHLHFGTVAKGIYMLQLSTPNGDVVVHKLAIH